MRSSVLRIARSFSLVLVVVVAGCGAAPSSSSQSSSASSSATETVTVAGTVATGTTGPDGNVTIPGPVEARALPVPLVPPAGSCRYGHAADGAVLPDRRCTPGAVDPAVSSRTAASTVCRSGYTVRVRPPVSWTDAVKRRLMAAYGQTGPLSGYELDHLVPLEAGGAPAVVANLWPEPYAGRGARSKDVVENGVRRVICGGRAGRLRALQAQIAADWTNVNTGGQ